MTRLIQDQASSVVRERDRRRLRAMVGMLVLGGVLVGAVLGYVWLHVQRVRVTYQLDALRSVRTRLDEQHRKLQLEVASLRAFVRVASAARRLGLMQPTPNQIQLAREYAAPEAESRSAALEAAARDAAMGTGRP